MAPSINVDQLVQAFQDKRVAEALAKCFDDVLSKRLASLENCVQSLNSELQKRDEQIVHLQEVNASLLERVHDLECYTRMDNIIVHGLPESYASAAADAANIDSQPNETSAESETTFLKFCSSQLKLPSISAGDISVCHRLKKGSRDRTRPMIIRFASRKARSLVLSARKHTRGTGIFINEHLTKEVSDLFASTRQLVKTKKIQSTWSFNCKLFIKLNDGRIKMVSTKEDINNIR